MGGVLGHRLLDEDARLLALLDLDGPLRQRDFRWRKQRIGLGGGLQCLDRVVELAGAKRFPGFLLIRTQPSGSPWEPAQRPAS
jgi:hypothetical protein